MIRAGRMRTRIRIVAPHDGRQERDSFGQPLNDPIEIRRAYAREQAVSGTEQFEAGAMRAGVTHQFTMRYHAKPVISAKMRVVRGDASELEIISVLHDERKVETTLNCVEQK